MIEGIKINNPPPLGLIYLWALLSLGLSGINDVKGFIDIKVRI